MKEMETGTLAVRSRKLGDLGSFTVDDLLTELNRCADEAEEMTLVGEVVEDKSDQK
jgi:threonyl-tRNA synthetase